MSDVRHTEIDEYAFIADTFVALTRNIHEITLCFEDTRIHYPVSVVSVNRAMGTCLIDITSLGDIDNALDRECRFTLQVRQSSTILHGIGMHSPEILRRNDRLGLRCPLPKRLMVTRRRSDFRVALRHGMRVAVDLTYKDQSWQAEMRDLSVGGCQLTLPVVQAEGLEIGKRLHELCARFPNGETFEARSHVTHLHVDQASESMHVGIAFDTGMDNAERQVWFYVREIEREAVRQTAERSEMRQLAPSRLFSRAEENTVSHGATPVNERPAPTVD